MTKNILRNVSFTELPSADLRVDAAYQGGRRGNAADDPLRLLLKVSNQGGFRYRGNLEALELVVLTSSLNDPDWPDALDKETGVLTYYGDNKRPGRALHDTPRNGNELLCRVFENAHRDSEGRRRVPPILVFANTGEWRDVVFLGLAIPSAAGLSPLEDLVAVWKLSDGKRFQNYRAMLTTLDAPVITRDWIRDILTRQPHSPNAPKAWLEWVRKGRFKPLFANRSLEYRTKSEQIPADLEGTAIIEAVQEFFAAKPHRFESCAAALARLMLPDIASLDLTRPSRDGGRDAVGLFRIGRGPASILVDFALEAKCYGLSNSVGVREMSRLISRLRHRQFGILVTTSYLHMQAYKELKEDRHPIIVISASDIVQLLKLNGYTNITAVRGWLEREFSQADTSSTSDDG